MGETSFIIALVIFNIIFLAFFLGIITFIRQYRIKKRKHLEEIHRIDETHKKELLETQIEIQTQTMKHIGRELHDNIGQKLTLASLYTQQLSFENKAPQINQNINEISEIINQSLDELRQLSKSLTSDYIDQHSISELIQYECERINLLKRCTVHFQNKQVFKRISYKMKSVLFRITQEFLQNSIKHAQCKNIYISLYKEAQNLHLILKDDGKGFDIQINSSKGIGLKNIAKRTELLGGKYYLTSQKDQGTQLTIEIPPK